MTRTLIVIFFSATILAACNRKTTADHGTKTENDTAVARDVFGNNDSPSNATPDNPFKNQPNAMCTVIRRIDVSLYDPKTAHEASDLSQYPPKYCLLDVCLDEITNPDLSVNLGDSTENVNATFHCMKIFNDVQEARNYAMKYNIIDTVFAE